MILRTTKTKSQRGYTTIVSAMARESGDDFFGKADLLKQCLIVQWLDYVVLFVEPATNSKTASEAVLIELNEYLQTRSYLVGQSLTLADVVVFYSLHNIMVRLARRSKFSSYLDFLFSTFQISLSSASKEHFGNVSRWFNHLQNNKTIRQNLPFVNLSNSILHAWTTGMHI